MKKWLKAELHTHTAEDPADGGRVVFHSAEQLLDRASLLGFEVLSITNHDQMLFNSGLEEYARSRGILLIPGVEATLQGKHTLLYNFSRYTPAWKDFQQVFREKGPRQLVIAPHPFFPASTALGADLVRWNRLFDGVEYSHFYLSWMNFNRRAQQVAHRLGCPMVGNSDVHHLSQLGRTSSLIYAEKEVDSVIRAVKKGQVRVVTRPVGMPFVASWLLRTVYFSTRHMLRSSFRSWFPDPARRRFPAEGQLVDARRR